MFALGQGEEREELNLYFFKFLEEKLRKKKKKVEDRSFLNK